MFSRGLTSEERQLLRRLESFINEKHARLVGHDYAHVLQVTQFAINIANSMEEEVDPIVLICGALLHDIGRTMSDDMHGLVGGTMAKELLESLALSREQIDRITKVIVRHTATSHVAPESVEEKILYDADGLDRLGAIGLLRGFMGKKEESMAAILERYMSKRVKDYDKLFFPVSRRIGKKLDAEMRELISLFSKRLNERQERVEELALP